MLDQIKKLQAERRLYYQALIDHRDFPYIVSNSTVLIGIAPGLYCLCVRVCKLPPFSYTL